MRFSDTEVHFFVFWCSFTEFTYTDLEHDQKYEFRVKIEDPKGIKEPIISTSATTTTLSSVGEAFVLYRRLKKEKEEIERKNEKMNDANDRLKDDLYTTQNELESMKKERDKYKQKVSTFEKKNQRLENSIDELQSWKKQLEQNLKTAEDRYNNLAKVRETEKASLQNRLSQLHSEKQNLSKKYSSFVDEMQHLYNSNESIRQELKATIAEKEKYEDELFHLRRELGRSNDRSSVATKTAKNESDVSKLRSTIESLEEDLNTAKRRIEMKEKSLSYLESQNTELSEQLNKKSEQIKDLEQQTAEKDKLLEDMNAFQSSFSEQTEEIQKLNRTLEETEEKLRYSQVEKDSFIEALDSQERKAKELEEKNASLQGELSKLRKETEFKGRQLEAAESASERIRVLENEREELQTELNKLGQSLQQKQERVSQLETDYQTLEDERKSQEEELNKLRSELSKASKEVEEYGKMETKLALSTAERYEQEIARLTQALEERTKDGDRLREQDEELKNLRQSLNDKSKEEERLHNLLVEKENTIEKYNQKIVQLEDIANKAQEDIQRIQSQHGSAATERKRVEEKDEEIKRLHSELAELQNNVDEYGNQAKHLKNELEKKIDTIDNLSSTTATEQSRLGEVEKQLNAKMTTIEHMAMAEAKVSAERDELSAQITALKNEMSEDLARHDESYGRLCQNIKYYQQRMQNMSDGLASCEKACGNLRSVNYERCGILLEELLHWKGSAQGKTQLVSDLSGEKSNLQAQLKEVNSTAESLRKENQHITEDKRVLEERLENYYAMFEDNDTALQSMQSKLEESHKAHDLKVRELQSLSTQYDRQSLEYEDVKARLLESTKTQQKQRDSIRYHNHRLEEVTREAEVLSEKLEQVQRRLGVRYERRCLQYEDVEAQLLKSKETQQAQSESIRCYSEQSREATKKAEELSVKLEEVQEKHKVAENKLAEKEENVVETEKKLRSNEESLTNTTEQLKEHTQYYEQRLKELEAQNSKLSEELKDYEEQRSRIEGKLGEKEETLNRTVEKWEDNVQHYEDKIKRLEEEKSTLLDQIKGTEEKLVATERSLQQKDDNLNHTMQKLEDDTHFYQEQIEILKRQSSKLSTSMEQACLKNEDLSEKLRQHVEWVKRLEESENALTSKLDVAEGDLVYYRSKVSEINDQKVSFEYEIKVLQDEISSKDSELRKISSQSGILSQETRMLKSEQERKRLENEDLRGLISKQKATIKNSRTMHTKSQNRLSLESEDLRSMTIRLLEVFQWMYSSLQEQFPTEEEKADVFDKARYIVDVVRNEKERLLFEKQESNVKLSESEIQLEKLYSQLEAEKEKVDKLQDSRKQLDHALEQYKKKAEDAESLLEESRRENKNLVTNIVNLEQQNQENVMMLKYEQEQGDGAIKELAENVNSLHRNLRRRDVELTNMEIENGNLKRELESFQETDKEKQNIIEELELSWDNVRREARHYRISADRAWLSNEDLLMQLERNQERLRQMQTSLDQSVPKLNTLQDRQKTNEKLLKAAHDSLARECLQEEDLAGRLLRVNEHMGILHEELEQYKIRLDEAKRENTELRNQLQFLSKDASSRAQELQQVSNVRMREKNALMLENEDFRSRLARFEQSFQWLYESAQELYGFDSYVKGCVWRRCACVLNSLKQEAGRSRELLIEKEEVLDKLSEAETTIKRLNEQLADEQSNATSLKRSIDEMNNAQERLKHFVDEKERKLTDTELLVQELKRENKTLSSNAITIEKQNQEKQALLKHEQNQGDGMLKSFSEQVAHLEHTLEQRNVEVANMEIENHNLKRRLDFYTETIAEKHDMQHHFRTNHEQMCMCHEDATSMLRRTHDQLSSYETTINVLKQEVEARNNELEQADSEVATLEESIRLLCKDLSSSNDDTITESSGAREDQTFSKANDEELEETNVKMENMSSRIAKVRKDVDNTHERKLDSGKRLSFKEAQVLETTIGSLHGHVSQLKDSLREREQKRTDAESLVEELRQENNILTSKLIDLEAKHQEILELVKRNRRPAEHGGLRDEDVVRMEQRLRQYDLEFANMEMEEERLARELETYTKYYQDEISRIRCQNSMMLEDLRSRLFLAYQYQEDAKLASKDAQQYEDTLNSSLNANASGNYSDGIDQQAVLKRQLRCYQERAQMMEEDLRSLGDRMKQTDHEKHVLEEELKRWKQTGTKEEDELARERKELASTVAEKAEIELRLEEEGARSLELQKENDTLQHENQSFRDELSSLQLENNRLSTALEDFRSLLLRKDENENKERNTQKQVIREHEETISHILATVKVYAEKVSQRSELSDAEQHQIQMLSSSVQADNLKSLAKNVYDVLTFVEQQEAKIAHELQPADVESRSDVVESSTANMESRDVNYDPAHERVNMQCEEVLSLNNELHDLRSYCDRCLSEKAIREERWSMSTEDLEESARRFSHHLVKLTNILHMQSEDLSSLRVAYLEQNQRLERRTNERDKAVEEKENELKRLSQGKNETVSQIRDLEAEMNRLRRDRDEFSEEAEKKSTELKKISRTMETVTHEKKSLEKRVERLETRNVEIYNERVWLEELMNHLEEDLKVQNAIKLESKGEIVRLKELAEGKEDYLKQVIADKYEFSNARDLLQKEVSRLREHRGIQSEELLHLRTMKIKEQERSKVFQMSNEEVINRNNELSDEIDEMKQQLYKERQNGHALSEENSELKEKTERLSAKCYALGSECDRYREIILRLQEDFRGVSAKQILHLERARCTQEDLQSELQRLTQHLAGEQERLLMSSADKESADTRAYSLLHAYTQCKEAFSTSESERLRLSDARSREREQFSLIAEDLRSYLYQRAVVDLSQAMDALSTERRRHAMTRGDTESAEVRFKETKESYKQLHSLSKQLQHQNSILLERCSVLEEDCQFKNLRNLVLTERCNMIREDDNTLANRNALNMERSIMYMEELESIVYNLRKDKVRQSERLALIEEDLVKVRGQRQDLRAEIEQQLETVSAEENTLNLLKRYIRNRDERIYRQSEDLCANIQLKLELSRRCTELEEKVEDLEAQLKSACNEKDQAFSSLTQKQQTISRLQEEASELQEELDEVHKHLKKKKKTLKEVETAKRELEEQSKRNGERIKELESKVNDSEYAMKHAISEKYDALEKASARAKEIEKLQHKVDDQEDRWRETTHQKDKQLGSLESQLSRYKEDHKEQESTILTQSNKIGGLEEKVSHLKSEVDQYKKQLEEKESWVKSLETKKKELSENYESTSMQSKTLEEQISEKSAKIENLKTQYDQLKAWSTRTLNKVQEEKGELEKKLKEVQDKYLDLERASDEERKRLLEKAREAENRVEEVKESYQDFDAKMKKKDECIDKYAKAMIDSKMKLAEVYERTNKYADLKLAVDMYKDVVDAGRTDVLLKMGSLYEQMRNPKQALDAYKTLADKTGNRDALYRLALMDEKGRVRPDNHPKSIEYCRKAADAGHSEAQFQLGLMYELGYGVEKSYEEAIKYYSQAAASNHTEAMFNLAWLHEDGRGVDVDEEKAFQLYKEASNLGHSASQCKLGALYEGGIEVARKDLEKSFYYYRKAADSGHLYALRRVAEFYERGIRGKVDRNVDRALTYYKRAKELGDKESANAIERLEKMTEAKADI